MTRNPVLILLDALAVYRLARLITVDTVTAPVRDRLVGERPAVSMTLGGERMLVPARPRLLEFITCPWCTSPYLAAVVTACQALAPRLWIYPACVLAFSAIAGLISEHA